MTNGKYTDPNYWKKLTSEANDLLLKLFPICRSITGNGLRQTLLILQQVVDFNISEIPSGKKFYDWTIPKEWNIQDAFIKNSSGIKVVDFKESNIFNYHFSII